MNLKVLYGGLSKSDNILIEDLIPKSPNKLVGSNLGSKVTRVALKRTLRDSTISVVLLNEKDYNQMQTSLSDDRLVCVFSEDSITNLFETKFGVERGIEDSDEQVEDEELSTDISEDVTEDGVLDEDEIDNLEDLTWEEILENYNKIGSDDFVDEDEVQFKDEQFIVSEDETTEEVVKETEDLLNLPVESEVTEEEYPSKKERALKRIIESLNDTIREQKDFLNESVSKGDYNTLKESYLTLKEDFNKLETELEKCDAENEGLVTELGDLKDKFKDLLIRFDKQKTELVKVKSEKSTLIKPIRRRYPNVEFIVPLSSNSVFEMYKYIASREDNLLFIDLTNNSFLDNFVKVETLVRPTKWLLEDWTYKRVTSKSTSHDNIRVISHIVHQFNSDILTRLDWDDVLGDLTVENKVIINIGSAYDNHVLNVLKAVESGVLVKGFVTESQRDQRVAKFALSGLTNYRVVAESKTPDYFGIITERYE